MTRSVSNSPFSSRTESGLRLVASAGVGGLAMSWLMIWAEVKWSAGVPVGLLTSWFTASVIGGRHVNRSR